MPSAEGHQPPECRYAVPVAEEPGRVSPAIHFRAGLAGRPGDPDRRRLQGVGRRPRIDRHQDQPRQGDMPSEGHTRLLIRFVIFYLYDKGKQEKFRSRISRNNLLRMAHLSHQKSPKTRTHHIEKMEKPPPNRPTATTTRPLAGRGGGRYRRCRSSTARQPPAESEHYEAPATSLGGMGGASPAISGDVATYPPARRRLVLTPTGPAPLTYWVRRNVSGGIRRPTPRCRPVCRPRKSTGEGLRAAGLTTEPLNPIAHRPQTGPKTLLAAGRSQGPRVR